MIKKYLLSRSNILDNIIKNNKNQIEKNQFRIIELNNEITELSNQTDEATKIFSVNSKNTSYHNTEIERVRRQIAALVMDNNECEKIIEITTKEFNIIKECLDELDTNVSRETFSKTTVNNCNNPLDIRFSDYIDNNRIKDEYTGIKNNYHDVSRETLYERLKFCARIAETDGYRTKLEIINLINDINELFKMDEDDID